MKKILLIGDAAREHAIVEQLAKDSEVYAIMGKKNPAIATLAKRFWLCDTSSCSDVEGCIVSSGEKFDLGFVSPDALLAAGITDVLAKHMPVASPSKAAARIEWDKGFMRSLMQKHGIPGQAGYKLVNTEEAALTAIKKFGLVAIKPIGLTGGKGVKVSGDHFTKIEDGMEYVREVLSKDGVVLIEEKLDGEEFSLQAFSDGMHVSAMPPVQDHKRAFNEDKGPNTGGMGSYSTGELLPFLEQKDIDDAKIILQKTIDAMAKEGSPFTGILYGQFMATASGIKVVEFNARFADPESMNVLALFEGSLSKIFFSMAAGGLKLVKFRNDCTVLKYLVPDGYPDSPQADRPLSIDDAKLHSLSAKAYLAAVYEKDGIIYTTKSRAVGILGVADTLDKAEQNAEAGCLAVKGVLRHRTDIGTRQLLEKRINHMRLLRAKKGK